MHIFHKTVEFKLVCLGTEEEVYDKFFVAGEDTAVFETGTDLIEALVDLIAAYYVFDACKLS